MSGCWASVRAILFMACLCILFGGCTNASTISAPPDAREFTEIQSSRGLAKGDGLLGVYCFVFDEENVALVPADIRACEAHYNVTTWTTPPSCGGPGCLTCEIKEWDAASRVLKVDASIANPTALTAYDIRLIFEHFVLRELVNADSYTPDYSTMGEPNPFIAFGKDSPSRVMGPAPAKITEEVIIHWPPGAGGYVFNIVEASWPGHCGEPFEIGNIAASGHLHPITTASVDISCDVLDWQDDVDSVAVDTTPFTGGMTELVNTSGNKWEAEIFNDLQAPLGDYPCWIHAHSPAAAHEDLYNKIVIQVRRDAFIKSGEFYPATGGCSPDIGVIGATGSSMDSHILMSGDDPNYAPPCDAIDAWTPYYGAGSMYASLKNLDPLNGTYQPWPVERIDATNDCASAWSNLDSLIYDEPGYTPPDGVANSEIFSSTNRDGGFVNNWPADQRHFRPSKDYPGWHPIDLCDDFDNFQYALMVDFTSDARLIGLAGKPYGDYLNIDVVYYTSFAANGFIGDSPGKIEAGDDIGGIDAMQMGPGKCRLFICENGSDWAIEAYDITNDQAGWDYDSITPAFNITFPGTVRPVDIELMPPHPGFTPNPGRPTIVVLIHFYEADKGGAWFYDALDGTYVGSFCTLGYGYSIPPLDGVPLYVDVDDGTMEVHTVEPGPKITVFSWV